MDERSAAHDFAIGEQNLPGPAVRHRLGAAHASQADFAWLVEGTAAFEFGRQEGRIEGRGYCSGRSYLVNMSQMKSYFSVACQCVTIWQDFFTIRVF